MENYIKVEVEKYVKQGLEDGSLVPRFAEKYARIIARQGFIGEKVISWSVDAHGNAVQEKVGYVKMNEQTNQLDWVVSKVDDRGNIVVDSNGHLNEWIIDDKTFKSKYEVDLENPELFKSKGGSQLFVQISDNIILDQWGSEMKIAAGGYINITDINDMYGISQRDFDDTYRFKDDFDIKSPRL